MQQRRAGLTPPHCPNPNCRYHKTLSAEWRFKLKGFYLRKTRPSRIQRFTCLECKRHFSTQSFKTHYYLKRPELLPRIFAMVVGCMCNRQIARALGCSPSTVALQLARLGRHCLLFQAAELTRIPFISEIAIDGFESFEWSQYFPFHHNIAVDVATGYFLFHTDSPLRRKGRMTPVQKARRAMLETTLGRPDPRAIETAVYDLLTSIDPTPRTIRSDDHPAYRRALRRFGVKHQITTSTQHRDRSNPLWEVNLLDLLIRHSIAAHKRETIAWAKRRQASIDKLSILQVWRNYSKRRREKGPRVTSAMQVGLTGRPFKIQHILAARRFYGHVRLTEVWQGYYRGTVQTRALRVNRAHVLTYAF